MEGGFDVVVEVLFYYYVWSWSEFFIWEALICLLVGMLISSSVLSTFSRRLLLRSLLMWPSNFCSWLRNAVICWLRSCREILGSRLFFLVVWWWIIVGQGISA